MAFALDYHGAHAPFASVDAMVARRNDLLGDADQVRALTGAALDVLSSHHAVDASRLAAIGYCLGGALVLELARTGADLKAVAGVHPSLHAITPADTPRIKGEVLVHIGGDDPLRPARAAHGVRSRHVRCGRPMAHARLRRDPPQLHQRHARGT